MSNKTVSAAAIGLSHIGRRVALAGSATLLATVAASALGAKSASAVSEGTPLLQLIEVHGNAYARLGETVTA